MWSVRSIAREQVLVAELVAQRGDGAGARQTGVDPTGECDHEERVLELGPVLDGQHTGTIGLRTITFAACGCASSPNLSKARRTTSCSASRKPPSGSASTRSSGRITTSASATVIPVRARPTRGSRSPRSDARRRRIRLGTLVTPVTFRFPGAARDPGRAGRRDERRPRRARARRGLVRRRACGVRRSRSLRRASASPCSKSSSRSSPACGPRRRTSGIRLRASTSRSSTRPRCRSRCNSPHPPIILGGWGTKRTPRLAAQYADEFNMPFAPVAALPRRMRPRPRGVHGRSGAIPSRCASPSRRSCASATNDAEYRRRAEASGQDPDGGTCQRDRRHTRRSRGTHSRVRNRPAPRPCTCSTSTLDDPEHLELIAAEVLPHV